MVVDEEVASVSKGHRVGAAVVIGEFAELHRAPRFSAVIAAHFKNAVLFGSSEGEEFVGGEKQDAGLDGGNGYSVVEGADFAPCFSVV